jgi:hypothetical protein
MPPRNSFSAKRLQTRGQWELMSAYEGQRPHTEALVKITSLVDPHDFHSHWTTVVFSPEYYCIAPVVLLDQVLGQMFVHVHRFGYE